jgi:hypothetical protein
MAILQPQGDFSEDKDNRKRLQTRKIKGEKTPKPWSLLLDYQNTLS